jgi:hypothetical protein
MSGAVWIGAMILIGAILLELFAPKVIAEGFKAMSLRPVAEKQNIITNMILKRGDVGPGVEDGNFKQDQRYFSDYADVQRYGVNNDFCRLVTPLGGKDDETFFACALAGTAPASSTAFRTPAVKDGFQLSRDDSMNDIMKDGRDAYCRIIKSPNGFLPQCRRALDGGFAATDQLDSNPPGDIATLLSFYEGCEMWLRLRDDMVDYIGRAVVQTAGRAAVDETPRPAVTKGLRFNGSDQFVRLGDSNTLELGAQIKLRTIRAFSIWAKFDEFTNNAHLFDFGDGPGKNNVFLGILGKGDAEGSLRPQSQSEGSTVPAAPSGAQFCPELKAQTLMEDSAANVDEYVCPGPEIMARKLPPIQTKPTAVTDAKRATLIYEVWDKTLRKVQIKVNQAVPKGKWVHIVITATNMDAVAPGLKVYVDGQDMYTLENGALPQAPVLSNNYLGKSNWASGISLYEMQDELFKGSMFDFRMYSAPLNPKKVAAIYQWGKALL